ncbi:bifunctional 23S rRNA (guanine(2069)-N(7))-methyltransferase RlmK/23S rRNA (guanine(2445)-N(2))-methyltransferase RlmL [Desulfomarina sp.]
MKKRENRNRKRKFTAICAVGLEALVEEEIREFGGERVACDRGVLSWKGSLETGYRACLWSRFSSKILLHLYRINATDEEELYRECLAIPWDSHLTVKTTFAVDCTLSGQGRITHSRYAALKVKDALVDFFRQKEGRRPSVEKYRPGVKIHVHIQDSVADVFIDLSGESLHRRGYRVSGGAAPLKETLAAALVGLSGWLAENSMPLLDPMCGTGTILIEAALMFGDSAPGLSRSYFGFMGWLQHDPELWQDLVDEAVFREEKGLTRKWPVMTGYDCDPVVVKSARENILRAGLEEKITIKCAELATLQSPAVRGMIISNLPYGERLSEVEQVSWLYRGFGRKCRFSFPGWNVGVFIANAELADRFNLVWEKKYPLFNGSLPCRLLVGRIEGTLPGPFQWNPSQQGLVDNEFANRLRKNLKKTIRWAKRESVFCFRIYDRDLPEYNISIDLYEKWVHIQEYAPPKTISRELARKRLKIAVRQIRDVLGVRSDRIFLKTRKRQKGKKQYQKKSNQRKLYEVREGGCSFLVNFTDYLDTGLFLDHRPVRERIFREAGGRKFLNLFGYTGSATLQAAAGGASMTTTVDLSATYTEWMRLNLALNGFCEGNHRIIQSDGMEWLRQDRGQYGLIFVDPPTFSNTRKEKRVFDIQRDHFQLIQLAMSRLESSGILFFSTNYRKFSLDPRLHEIFTLKDISRKTIPFDFSRNSKIHKCWEVRKK